MPAAPASAIPARSSLIAWRGKRPLRRAKTRRPTSCSLKLMLADHTGMQAARVISPIVWLSAGLACANKKHYSK